MSWPMQSVDEICGGHFREQKLKGVHVPPGGASGRARAFKAARGVFIGPKMAALRTEVNLPFESG